MTDQIPKMPEREHTDDDLITCLCCGGSTPHETAVGECCWHELRLRLAASNALCAELAEALGIAKEAMAERRGYCEAWEWKYSEIWDAEDTKIRSALAKLKEATR